MENTINLKELSLNEMKNIIGGGKISDLVVQGLTWCGDMLSKLRVEDAELYC